MAWGEEGFSTSINCGSKSRPCLIVFPFIDVPDISIVVLFAKASGQWALKTERITGLRSSSLRNNCFLVLSRLHLIRS
jgi:hypothetical protein